MSVNIKIRDAVKRYGNNTIISDLSLDIKEGEFFTLLGPSGCGKTTLLRMIAGFNSIEGGDFYFNDKRINDMDPAKRNIGMVFQNYAIFPNLTVEKNVAFGLKNRKLPEAEIKEKTDKFLKLMQIDEYRDRMPDRLSGGQQQRVALARALAITPDVLLMDEPLSNLDAKLRTQMRIELSRIHREFGCTIVYVTHDQTEAMTLGSRIVVLNAGIIQQVAAPNEIYDHPVNLFVAGFIGSPSMNFLEAVVSDVNGKTYAVLTGFPEKFQILIEGEKGRTLRERYIGQKIILGIRPEDFYDEESAAKLGLISESNYVESTVSARELLGSEVQIYCTYPGRDLASRLSVSVEKEPGDRIRLYPDMSRVHFFDKKTEKNIF